MGDNTTNISKDESILGGGKGGEQQTSFSRIPVSAHSADTKIENAICKLFVLVRLVCELRVFIY